MGCCCFNTLRGAAFFVASIHIYNGLECMLKFIAFPMVFSAMHNKDAETPFMAFLPGMIYALIYFLLGCAIFRGIETEAIGAVKWSAVGFAVTEVVFFILRVVLGMIPTPTVPELPKGDQPFEWNIYKTLNYFLFTIVGGLVYICILFLYVQKLSTGRDEFAQLSSFLSNRNSANPPPFSNNNTSGQQNNSRSENAPKSTKPHDPERKPSNKGESDRKGRVGIPPGTGVGSVGAKEPQSPGSPMFPYFLLRRSSKLNASNKSGQQERMVEEPPATWHQPRVQGVSLLNRQEFEGPPGRGEIGGRNLLSPSMLNHHQPPLPPPHGFQPIPPPFYSDSGDERRESFVPGGFVSPTGSHYQTGYGRGQEALYQKIPMSPGFDYCLR